jgi:hypothetical protein
VGPVVVVTVDVTGDNPEKLGLCKDDEVVQTFLPDRTDEPFGVGIHVGGIGVPGTIFWSKN